MASVTRLRDAINEIVEDAYAELHPAIQPHYRAVGAAEIRHDLRELVELVIAGLEHQEAVHIVRYAEEAAARRFHRGYRLGEVQAVFNAVEQAMWTRVSGQDDEADAFAALGLLSSVVGAGKDALARTWVDLASAGHRPGVAPAPRRG